MLINQSINQLPTISQVNNCRVVPMTVFFDRCSYSECLLALWLTVRKVLPTSTSRGDTAVVAVTWPMILLAYVTLTDNRWEMDRWPIFSQACRSHDVPCVRKWQMFVKYTSRRNATWHSSERESTCKQWRNLIRVFLNVFLTVHLSVTSVNDQTNVQFFYFLIRLL